MDPLGAAALAKPYATRARVKQQLGDVVQGDSAADPLLDSLLLVASRAIDQHCSRRFAREVVTETIPGDGTQYLMLSRCPVLSVSGLLYNNDPVTDSLIEDAHAGLLFRQQGFTNVQQVGWFLGEQRAPFREEKRYVVSYVGGYLLPADDVVSRTLSCVALDQTYRDSASGFPLLQPGDQFLADGFTHPENTGWKTVVSATASQIVVAGGEPLVDEAAPGDSGADRLLTVRTLPEDLQQACVEIVKLYWMQRQRDPEIVGQSVGDLSIQYRGRYASGVSSEAAQQAASIPFTALGLLKPYERVA